MNPVNPARAVWNRNGFLQLYSAMSACARAACARRGFRSEASNNYATKQVGLSRCKAPGRTAVPPGEARPQLNNLGTLTHHPACVYTGQLACAPQQSSSSRPPPALQPIRARAMTWQHYEPTAQQLARLQTQPMQQQPPMQREELQAPASPPRRKLPTKFLTNDLSWLSRRQDALTTPAMPSPHLMPQPIGGAQPGYQVALV